MALSVPWRVMIAGRDMSDRMNPYIESIECTDKAGDSADTATLVFDDTDGQCILPPKGAEVEIYLANVSVFSGVTDVPECVGARGSGMQINVSCTGHDKRGKLKQRLGLHKDDATFEDFMKAAAKAAGLDGITIDKAFKSIKRPYWSTDGRSFVQLGREHAAEFGATFKIRGKKAVFAKRGQGGTPGGGSMPTIQAIRGQNMRTYRLTPAETRPRFTKARQRNYNRKTAKWEESETEIGTAPASAEAADIGSAAKADKDAGKNAADGGKTESEREGGSGDVTLDLDVSAFAEGTCVVSRVRAGCDGSYRIESRTHHVDREGSETRLSLKQPQGDAGSDSRSSKSS